jgi:hypothetical protein
MNLLDLQDPRIHSGALPSIIVLIPSCKQYISTLLCQQFPPAGYGPSQYDLDEKARVASVRLQSILKPPSKKDKKAVP